MPLFPRPQYQYDPLQESKQPKKEEGRGEGGLTRFFKTDRDAPIETPLRTKYIHIRHPSLLNYRLDFPRSLSSGDSNFTRSLRMRMEGIDLFRVGVGNTSERGRGSTGFDESVQELVIGFMLVLNPASISERASKGARGGGRNER